MATSTGQHPMAEGSNHHIGFNKALDKALKKMESDFDKGSHTVDVKFQLGVDVSSPGTIGYYQVTVTTS